MHETSIPGIFNLGVSGVAPWETARHKGQLSKFIEDTQDKVQQVCRGVLQHVGVLAPHIDEQGRVTRA